MARITPDIDIYGRYATASALADYLELLSLHGVSISRASVADMVEDNDWGRRIQENFFAG